jgi:hypothetical protein
MSYLEQDEEHKRDEEGEQSGGVDGNDVVSVLNRRQIGPNLALWEG